MLEWMFSPVASTQHWRVSGCSRGNTLLWQAVLKFYWGTVTESCYREFPAPLFWFSVSLWLWHSTEQKQLSGGKGLCCPSAKYWGKPEQELKAEMTGNTTHSLMLSWLSYTQPRTTCVGMDTTQSGLGNPMLMNNQDRKARGPIWSGQLLNWDFLLRWLQIHTIQKQERTS